MPSKTLKVNKGSLQKKINKKCGFNPQGGGVQAQSTLFKKCGFRGGIFPIFSHFWIKSTLFINFFFEGFPNGQKFFKLKTSIIY